MKHRLSLRKKSLGLNNITVFVRNSHFYSFVTGLNPAEERHVSITFEYLVISHYSSRNEKDWRIADTGRVKFHLMKGIRSPLTRNVLLDDSGGGRIPE